jgi:hypothetical protein
LLAAAFNAAGVEYLFIGKSGAVIHGYPGTTQDVDIFPRKSPENGKRLVRGLRKLRFKLDASTCDAILRGKDFVQIRSGPFDIDIVFAPDGIKSFDEALRRSVMIGPFPVAHIEDIIRSKAAAKRQRDLLELPLLREFAKTLRSKFTWE